MRGFKPIWLLARPCWLAAWICVSVFSACTLRKWPQIGILQVRIRHCFSVESYFDILKFCAEFCQIVFSIYKGNHMTFLFLSVNVVNTQLRASQVAPWERTHGQESVCQLRKRKRHRFNPWVGRIHWRRAWQPIQVFLPGEAHREEPGWQQSRGLQKVRHDWSNLACMHAHK